MNNFQSCLDLSGLKGDLSASLGSSCLFQRILNKNAQLLSDQYVVRTSILGSLGQREKGAEKAVCGPELATNIHKAFCRDVTKNFFSFFFKISCKIDDTQTRTRELRFWKYRDCK